MLTFLHIVWYTIHAYVPIDMHKIHINRRYHE